MRTAYADLTSVGKMSLNVFHTLVFSLAANESMIATTTSKPVTKSSKSFLQQPVVSRSLVQKKNATRLVRRQIGYGGASAGIGSQLQGISSGYGYGYNNGKHLVCKTFFIRAVLGLEFLLFVFLFLVFVICSVIYSTYSNYVTRETILGFDSFRNDWTQNHSSNTFLHVLSVHWLFSDRRIFWLHSMEIHD